MNATLLVLALLGATAIPGIAAVQIIFDDGLHHLVDASNSAPGDGVYVKNSSLGAATSVTIAAGADLGAHAGYSGVVATEASVVRITGASLNSDTPALAMGTSHLIVTSGRIGDAGSVVSLIGRDESVVDVPGGTFRVGGRLVGGNAHAHAPHVAV